jgi:activator of 2-hydroxyglutaryl-CoA dehydratase
MICAWLDVNSGTIKLVIFNGEVLDTEVINAVVTPLKRCRELLSGKEYEKLVVTGYVCHLVAPVLKGEVVTEIKAFAAGAYHDCPDCRTEVDIGGRIPKSFNF